jgi:DNA modification methylase
VQTDFACVAGKGWHIRIDEVPQATVAVIKTIHDGTLCGRVSFQYVHRMMVPECKSRERRIRRTLHRLGLMLVRTRSSGSGMGGYLISNTAGDILAGPGHTLTLDDAEAWLRKAGHHLHNSLTGHGSGTDAGIAKVLRTFNSGQISEAVNLHVGDALDVLRTLPDSSFQCCVTSPPYFSHRDYGMSGQIGQEDTPDVYVSRLVEVFAEVRRTLRKDGTLWLVIGDSYNSNPSTTKLPRTEQGNGKGMFIIPRQDQVEARRGRPNRATPLIRSGIKKKDIIGIPWLVAFALRKAGWYLRSAIVWEKPNMMPESADDRPTQTYEMVFLLSKSARYFYNGDAIVEASKTAWNFAKKFSTTRQRKRQGVPSATSGKDEERTGRNARNIWRIATTPSRYGHFATMPVELAARCILAGSAEGDLVLDPFAGTGTTAIAAVANGRRCTLIELNPDYAEICRRRVAEASHGIACTK